MKIVILDGYALNPGDLDWKGFESLGTVSVYDRTPEDKIIERIGDAEAVIVNKITISRELLKSCPGIKYVGVLATGYNIVDIQACVDTGVVVTNIPTYGTDAVAQFAIALLLEICHHAAHHSRAVYEGRWEANKSWCFWDYPLIELSGKTMGIIGFGRIGRTTGRIARALGMNVIAYDKLESDEGREIGQYVELNELLAKSDVISLHCPLTQENTGIICRDTIAKMKDGVIILNNARGQLIVEEDLAEALNSGKVYAAGLDVVSTEPISGDNPLLKAKNCIITPHISWAPREARERLMNIAVDNLNAFICGRPVNVVNILS